MGNIKLRANLNCENFIKAGYETKADCAKARTIGDRMQILDLKPKQQYSDFTPAELKHAANLLMYISIALVVAYAPRFFYFIRLWGYNYCGGNKTDTSEDRKKVLHGFNGMLVSNILSIVCTIIIMFAWKGDFGKF